MAGRSEVEHEPRVCDAALTRAFSFLGKRWNGVLLGALVQGPAGFAELLGAPAGVARGHLAERFVRAVAEDFLGEWIALHY